MAKNDLDFQLSDEFKSFLTTHPEPWHYEWMPCLRCGSKRVVFKPKISNAFYFLQRVAWAVLIIMSGILPGILIYIWVYRGKPHPTRDFRCFDCGLQWNRENLK